MEARGIHHLGVAVVDLDDAVDTYERLFGARLEHRAPLVDAGRRGGIRCSSARVASSCVAPTGDDTPVGRFLARRGPGMHHVAYEVGDVACGLSELESAGAQLIDGEPRQGLFGLRWRSSIPMPSMASSRRWCPVAETRSSRIEIGFEGGQIMSALVTCESADALEREVRRGQSRDAHARCAGRQRSRSSFERVVYVKRYAREARVGFAA